MKKIFSICAILAALCSFTACDSDTDIEAGGTKIEQMAGLWEVQVDAIIGDDYYEDPYGLGLIQVSTYNTASNSTSEMWIDDNGNFWAFKFKCPINLANKTFACKDVDYDSEATGKATIKEGKILLGQGHNIHGMPCDSIYFTIEFDDDDNGATWVMSGNKYSGFYE